MVLFAGKSNGQDVTWNDSRDDESQVWRQVLERPNTWCDATLQLRSAMDVRKK